MEKQSPKDEMVLAALSCALGFLLCLFVVIVLTERVEQAKQKMVATPSPVEKTLQTGLKTEPSDMRLGQVVATPSPIVKAEPSEPKPNQLKKKWQSFFEPKVGLPKITAAENAKEKEAPQNKKLGLLKKAKQRAAKMAENGLKASAKKGGKLAVKKLSTPTMKRLAKTSAKKLGLLAVKKLAKPLMKKVGGAVLKTIPKIVFRKFKLR